MTDLDNCRNELLFHLEKIHTTDLGAVRIRNNLSLDIDDVVNWCKLKIENSSVSIIRKGKNWYVHTGDCVITVNAHSYTIITAHTTE